MSAGYDRINDDHSAREVDRILTQKFGISLYRFARAFAGSIRILQAARRQICSTQQISELRKIGRDLDRYVRRKFQEIQRLSTAHLVKARGGIPFEYLPSEVGGDKAQDLKYLGIDQLIDRANFAAESLETTCKTKRGNYLDPRSVVAASWGNLLKKHRHEKWIQLADLYSWFWARLKPWPFYSDLEPPGFENEYLRNFLRSRYVRYGSINLRPARWTPGDRTSVTIVHLVDKLDIKGGVFFDTNWAWFDYAYTVTCRCGLGEEVGFADLGLPQTSQQAIARKFGKWAADQLDILFTLKGFWPSGLRQIYSEFKRKGIDLEKNSPPLIVFPSPLSLKGKYSDFYSPLL